MDRLIKRTQINRGEAKILGEDEKEDPASEEEQDEEEMDEKTRIKKRIEKQKQQKKLKQQQILQQKKQKKTEGEEMDQLADPDSNLKEYVEIYDDMDFYKALLKDLVDRRMADTNVASSVKWTITKNNNGKDKNNEDKFSKDRRLNFKIQENSKTLMPHETQSNGLRIRLTSCFLAYLVKRLHSATMKKMNRILKRKKVKMITLSTMDLRFLVKFV